MTRYKNIDTLPSTFNLKPFILGLALMALAGLPGLGQDPEIDLGLQGSNLVDFCARFWIKGNDDFVSKTYMSESYFQSQRDRLYDLGYRLKDLEIREYGDQLSFSAIWVPGDGPEVCLTGLPWQQFEQAWDQQISQGLILADLESYVSNGVRYFAGVWKQSQTSQQALLGPVSGTTFMQQHQVLENQGFRLTDVEAFVQADHVYMIGVWDFGGASGIFLDGMNWNAFHEKFHELNDQNYRLEDFESYLVDGHAYYAGLWYPSTREDLLVILDSSWTMDQFPTSEALDGYTLVDIELFKEAENAESYHTEPELPALVIGKSGSVTAPTDPTGTLMPLHNGGSTGPGN